MADIDITRISLVKIVSELDGVMQRFSIGATISQLSLVLVRAILRYRLRAMTELAVFGLH